MSPVLKRMGVCDAFDEVTSKITRMATYSTGSALYIAEANQGTKVEVNAEGVSAIAHTKSKLIKAIGSMDTPVLPPKRMIRFVHPFLFAIWQSRPTLIPLVIGTFQKQ